MQKVCYFKLITGEDIISKIELLDLKGKKMVRMTDPYVMIHHIDPVDGIRDYAVKYMPLTDSTTFLIDAAHIITITHARSQVAHDYEVMIENEKNESDEMTTPTGANNMVLH